MRNRRSAKKSRLRVNVGWERMNKVMMIYFLVLAATVIVYYALPLKRRWIALLAFSIVFYAVNSTYLFVFIASTTLSVYFCARYIQKSNDAPVAAGEDLAANAKKVKKTE